MKQIYAKDIDFYQKILVDRGAVGSYIPSQSGEAYSKADPFFGGQKVFLDFAAWNKLIPSVNYGIYTYEADNAIMAKLADVLNSADVSSVLQDAEKQVKAQIK